jgi:phosphoglycerate dehydrogenase-like enzyme
LLLFVRSSLLCLSVYLSVRLSRQVLLLERINKSAIDEFVQDGFQVESVDKLSESELIEKIRDVHAIGVRSRTQLTKAVFEAAKKLLVIGAFCIGNYQSVQFPRCAIDSIALRVAHSPSVMRISSTCAAVLQARTKQTLTPPLRMARLYSMHRSRTLALSPSLCLQK